MSTRSTIELIRCKNGEDTIIMELYHEMHDNEVHLSIEIDYSNVALNLVIPKVLVKGVTEILKRTRENK
jgi:hypothetical protein